MDEVLKRMNELENRVLKLEQGQKLETSIVSSVKKTKQSVGEFLKEKKPITALDKALVFASYYETSSGTESFNADDIKALWRQAKETPPSNINDLFQKNVKRGTMAEDDNKKGDKKAWYVTSTGVENINKGFNKE
jgi:hypothetical protein